MLEVTYDEYMQELGVDEDDMSDEALEIDAQFWAEVENGS